MADAQHLACPCGKSTDAYALYDDTGWGRCFSGACDKPRWSPKMMQDAGYDKDAAIANAGSGGG